VLCYVLVSGSYARQSVDFRRLVTAATLISSCQKALVFRYVLVSGSYARQSVDFRRLATAVTLIPPSPLARPRSSAVLFPPLFHHDWGIRLSVLAV
jgi:hypothetical protein